MMSGLDDIDIICAGYQELGSEINPPYSPSVARITATRLSSTTPKEISSLAKAERLNNKKHQDKKNSSHLGRGHFRSKQLKESLSEDDDYGQIELDTEDDVNNATVSSLTPLTVNVISGSSNLRSSFDPHKLAEERAKLRLDLNGTSSSRMNSLFKVQPNDPCNSVYFALLLAGVGFLLPYNSFVSAVDYFQDKFPGTTVIFDMSFIYILVSLFSVAFTNVLVESISLSWRINIGYLVSFGTLCFVALVEIYWESFPLTLAYKLNLLCVAIVSFGCTLQQSSYYGYTSMLPTRYTQAVMTGESAAGLIVSINRILTKSLLEDERINTLLFFSISIVIILICVVTHNVLQRTAFVKFYIELCSAPTSNPLPKDNLVSSTGKGTKTYHNLSNDKRGDSFPEGFGKEELGLVEVNDSIEQPSNQRGVYGSRTESGSRFHVHRHNFLRTGSDRRRSLKKNNVQRFSSGDTHQMENQFTHSDSTEFDMPFGIDDEDLLNYQPPKVIGQSEVKVNFRKKSIVNETNASKVKNLCFNLDDAFEEIDVTSDPEMSAAQINNQHLNNLNIETEDDGNIFMNISRISESVNSNNYGYFYFPMGHRSTISNYWNRFLIFCRLKYTRARTKFVSQLDSRTQVVALTWPFMVSIFMAYLVTLSLFPGIETEVISCDFKSWMPVLLMFTFNLTDFLGKILSSFFYSIRPLNLMFLTFARILLLPMLYLCVAPRTHPWFAHESWSFMLTSILGISNGVCGSLPMIIASTRVSSDLKEITGNLMTLSYSVGLTVGSIMAYILEFSLDQSDTAKNVTEIICNTSPNLIHYHFLDISSQNASVFISNSTFQFNPSIGNETKL